MRIALRFENRTRLLAQARAAWHKVQLVKLAVPRRLLGRLLVIVGACLLAITLGAYSWMTVEQHRLTATHSQAAPGNGLTPVSNVPTAVQREPDVTLLSIPKIHLDAAVLEGTDSKTLLLAPGHLKKTALPGDAGNSVIAGHRDTFFRHVYELNPGDEIVVQRAGHEFHYVVESKAIVGPQDTWVTQPSHDTRLTLITCYPTYYIGPAPKRAIVIATLRPAKQTASNANPRS
jgi:sortase A